LPINIRATLPILCDAFMQVVHTAMYRCYVIGTYISNNLHTKLIRTPLISKKIMVIYVL